MRPYIEKISHRWLTKHFINIGKSYDVFAGWHYHSEFELVVCYDPHGVLNSTAMVGDRCYNQCHNSLVLYGPGVPHMVTSSAVCEPHMEVSSHIFWFAPEWIEQLLDLEPSLSPVRQVLSEASRGIQFSKQCAERVSSLMRNTINLSTAKQFSVIVEILMTLAEDNYRKPLTSSSYSYCLQEASSQQQDKVKRVLRYIEKHYAEPIRVADLCKELHMSESSVYRLFERHLLESFADHLKHYRIGKACERLINTNQPISYIAENTGFNNQSNFNRQFKQNKKMTPSAFRNLYRHQLSK